MQVAREANAELLELPPEWEASDPAALLAAVANELHSTQEATRLSALLWLNTLLSRSRKTVRCLAALDREIIVGRAAQEGAWSSGLLHSLLMFLHRLWKLQCSRFL